MRNEIFQLPPYFKRIREVEKQLDQTNIQILSAMATFGPRNLLEIARRTKLPFTSVYHRVAKLEAKTGRIAYLVPQTSRLGMVRIVQLNAAKAGVEDVVTEALKTPNWWRFINRCEGAFTHLSVHTVPVNFLRDFKNYMQRLSKLELVTQLKIIQTGDYVVNPKKFSYYDPDRKEWKFEWTRWGNTLNSIKDERKIEDPDGYPLLADKKDLIIVKELEKNARISFAKIAPLVGISLQGVKYHYDNRLVPSEIIRYFDYDVFPYPLEISAYIELMLEFTSNESMNKFFAILTELFFVLGVAKVVRANALIVRTYIPESQLRNMFSFFSEMAKGGMLKSFSSVRLEFAERETQTLSYELFDEREKGWMFDAGSCLSKLDQLCTVTS
jgi:DNA-binding Lrp family transcriptional regulator